MKNILIFAVGSMLLSGCAEHNFVPGSFLARANGYNRSYEQIASDDCSNKYGFDAGSYDHKKCVFELSMQRKASDNAYMANSAELMRNGAKMMSGSSAPSQPDGFYKQGTHTYLINGRYFTCTTTGSITSCF